MTGLFEGYVERFKSLVLALADGSETEWGKCDELAREAVATLGDDAHKLLQLAARSSGAAYFSMAMAMDNARAFSEIGPEGAPGPSSGSLKFCPVTVEMPVGERVPRRLSLGSWMPPLPDGRPVPAAADFLLTFEEAYSTLSKVRLLHEVLGGQGELQNGGMEATLTEAFGESPASSAFDKFEISGSREASLRFMPAYARSAEESWFRSDAQMREWQRAARENLANVVGSGPWPYPMAPASYLPALQGGFLVWLKSRLHTWYQEAPTSDAPEGMDRNPSKVQLEVFGSLGCIANSVRLSLLGPDLTPCPHSLVWFLPFESQKADWQKSARWMAELLRRDFRSEVVALPPVVQDQEFLFSDLGARRLHVVLGRSMVFQGSPDGLPWDFPSDPAMKSWAEMERKTTVVDSQLIQQQLEAALDLEPGCLSVSSSMALLEGTWHPAHIVYFRDAQRADGTSVLWPPSDQAIREFKGMLALTCGRERVGIWYAGQA